MKNSDHVKCQKNNPQIIISGILLLKRREVTAIIKY